MTQVEVAADDPAFASPSKPIGSFMDEATAIRRRDQDGWAMREDAGARVAARRRLARADPDRRGGRDPGSDRAMASSSIIVGGGGIPVVADENGDSPASPP